VTTATLNQVYKANGSGSGSWGDIAGGLNSVAINAAEDFPAASGGIITLADNTVYVISGTIVITDTITPGTGSSIVSLESHSNELSYTGTGSMFLGTNKSLHVSSVSLRCANGTLLDFTDTAPLKESVIEFSGVEFVIVKHVGLCTDIKQLRYFACVYDDITTTGHTFAGDIEQVFAGASDFVMNAASPVFDLGTATFDLMWSSDFQVKLLNAGATFVTGLASGANINTSGTGQLVNGLYLGTGTALSGVSSDDLLWFFHNNSTIANTAPDAVTYMTNNATETVISTQNVPVPVLGTFSEHRASHFSTTAAGRITYLGQQDHRTTISASLTAKTASGSDKDITIYVALNGSIVANSAISNNAKLSTKNNTVMIWKEVMSTNDYIEIWVENNIDTINIVVEDINFVAS
jgi:hypothetical protein